MDGTVQIPNPKDYIPKSGFNVVLFDMHIRKGMPQPKELGTAETLEDASKLGSQGYFEIKGSKFYYRRKRGGVECLVECTNKKDGAFLDPTVLIINPLGNFQLLEDCIEGEVKELTKVPEGYHLSDDVYTSGAR